MSADTPNDAIPQVLSEIHDGDALGLASVGRLFPGHRGAGSLSPSTPFRWIVKGVRSADGRLVKLEAVRVGTRWVTSRAAVGRFVALTTAAGQAPDATPRSPAARNKADEIAGRELENMGV